LFSPTPEQYKGRFFLENTSPKDQQQRNDPILLPVSEDTETAIRFSDPILHRAENISISRMSAEIQSPTRYWTAEPEKSPFQASVDRNTTLLSPDCRKAAQKA